MPRNVATASGRLNGTNAGVRASSTAKAAFDVVRFVLLFAAAAEMVQYVVVVGAPRILGVRSLFGFL